MLSEFFNENDYSAESELVREAKWKKNHFKHVFSMTDINFQYTLDEFQPQKISA